MPRALAVVLALVVACTPPQPAPTNRPTPSATPVAATSSAPTPTAAGSGSPSPSARATAIASEDRADVDGDGKADKGTLETAWSDSSPGPADSTVRVALASGKTITLLLHDTFDPQVALVADADGDHHDEIFVRVSLGASTEFWVIVTLVGDQLTTVHAPGTSEDLVLGVNGSVTHGDGFECRTGASGDHELVIHSFEQTTLTDTVYAWQGKTLVRTGSTVMQFREDMRNDPSFSMYYTARCGQPTR
jgi:hypothetical protein